MGNSLGRAPWGRSEMEATTGWTDGKLGDDMVDVGNSLGRAPLGRSETEATTGWTEGKLWEIVVGKERDGSDHRVKRGSRGK